MIDLTQFCSQDRDELSQPIPFDNDELGASDGHILVVLQSPAGAGVAFDESDTVRMSKRDSMKKLIDTIDWTATPHPFLDWQRLVLMTPTPCKSCDGKGTVLKCKICDGRGEVECDMGHDHDCDLCSGTGCSTIPAAPAAPNSIECWTCDGHGTDGLPPKVGVEIMPNVFIDQVLLEKIVALPGAMLAAKPGHGKHDPVPFVFDGGRGVVMPLYVDRASHKFLVCLPRDAP